MVAVLSLTKNYDMLNKKICKNYNY